MSMNLTDINEIKALLSRHGFRFSKSMGQNFLTASWVPEDIADSALLDENTGVLEIGPGIGCLTVQLAQRAAKVLSVELDKSLRPVLAETLAGHDNVEVLFGDILKQNIPALIEERFGPLRPVVCANLPYNITSPVLTALIRTESIDAITVMIQREVARRICAAPGSKDYGAFGIFVQWYMETELLFDVSPGCFIPQPKVTSSVIRLRRRREPVAAVKDEKLLFSIVNAAFNQRRKTLVNALSSALSLDKALLEKLLTECNISVQIRGEKLKIEEFALISDKISSILAKDL